MKKLVLLQLLLLSPAAFAVTCDQVDPAPQAPEKIRQFHFMIGQHDVDLHAWNGHAWTPPRPQGAQWNGWYGLSGMAVYDEWIDPDANRGGLGVNVRVYDQANEQWKMMWVATWTLQVQDLRAALVDGVLTMWQVYPERPGWKAEFSVLDAHSWQRVDYNQDAQGVWQPGFKLVATRTGCP